MRATISFIDHSKFPPNYWKWLAIALLILLAIVLYLWLGLPNLEAHQEPDWDILIPIIIQIESNGNPNAVSKAGCIGLMQISEIVLKEWNDQMSPPPVLDKTNNLRYIEPRFAKETLFNPDINITIGTWYLKRIWFHYLPHYELEQNIQNLCYAYNMGIGNLVKYKQGKIKLPEETKQYWLKYKKLAKKK